MTEKSTQRILEEIFEKLSETPPNSQPTIKVAIISTPRCGSSFFCDILSETGQFGKPMEWFNMRYMQAWAQVTGKESVDFNQYLNWVMERTTSPNGVFSVNFHVEQYELLYKKGLDVMKLGFDQIYQLRRRDKLAQAYSLYKAQVTDQWSSDSKAKASFNENSVTNSDLIKRVLHIAQSEDLFEELLSSRTDRVFEYEDFKNLDKTTAFSDIWNDCNIDTPLPETMSTNMTQQSTNVEPASLRSLRQYLMES